MAEEIDPGTGLPLHTARGWGLLPYEDPATARLDARRKTIALMEGSNRCFERDFIIAEAIARAEFKANKTIVQKVNEMLDIFKSNLTTAQKITALAEVEKLEEPTAQTAFAAIKDELRD